MMWPRGIQALWQAGLSRGDPPSSPSSREVPLRISPSPYAANYRFQPLSQQAPPPWRTSEQHPPCLYAAAEEATDVSTEIGDKASVDLALEGASANSLRAFFQSEDGNEKRDAIQLLSDLPVWLVPETVRRLAVRTYEKDKRTVPLGVTAGQALPLVMVATLALWSFFAGFAIHVRYHARCNEHGFAEMDTSSFCICVPFLIVLSSCEVLSLRYIIVPKYQVLTRFRICGVNLSKRCPCGQNKFWVWFSYTFLTSMAQYLNFASQGLFLGKMLKTSECQAGPELDHVWNETMRASMFGLFMHYIGLGDAELPSFSTICLVGWSLQFSRLLLGLLSSIPIDPPISGVDYEICFDEGRRYVTTYETVLHHETKQNHGAALVSLAQTNGMNLIFFDDLDYANKKAQDSWLTRNRAISTNEHDEHYADCLNKTFSHINNQAIRGLMNVMIMGFFCGSFQINLQGSALMLEGAVSGTRLIHQRGKLFSLFLSYFPAGFSLANSSLICIQTFKWLKTFNSEIRSDALDERIASLRRWLVVVFVSWVFYVIFLIYGFVKVIMSIAVCDNKIWNLTGCVAFRGTSEIDG